MDDSTSDNHILSFDIETTSVHGFPNWREPKESLLSIAYYSSVTKEYYCLVVDSGQPITYGANKTNIIPCKNEEQLIYRYLKHLEFLQPTIFTGWNIDNFDIPYLYWRIRRTIDKATADRLSPIGIIDVGREEERVRIAGISSLDYYFLYKKYTINERPSYRLGYIGEAELGMGKIEHRGSLDETYAKEIDNFIRYNLRDVHIVVDLEEKLKFIKLAIEICHKGHVPYEDIHMQSRPIDGAVLTYAKRKGLVVNTREATEKKEKFKGAFVKSPQVGLYDWVFDLDFTSLYPSLMIELNISPETKLAKIVGWENRTPEDIIENNVFEVFQFKNNKVDRATYNDITEMLKNNNVSISANGIVYDLDRKGITVEIIKEWLDERKKLKASMIKAYKQGDETLGDELFLIQYAYKILANSLYGVVGSNTFRFYDEDNAEAITKTGQSALKYTYDSVNEFYRNMGCVDKDYIIYSDTDSIFATTVPLLEKKFGDKWQKNPIKYSIEMCNKIQSYANKKMQVYSNSVLFINKERKTNLNLKQEIIAKAGLFIKKKRYGLWVVDEEGVPKDEIVVKGLDIVRSSYPKVFQDTLKTILKKILEKENKEDIDKFIFDFRKKVKQMPIVDVATPTGVKNIKKYTADNGRYKKGSPAHVKASINYNSFIKTNKLSKSVEIINSNDKIKWIYLNENPKNIASIAFKNDFIPKKLESFIKPYIAYDKIFKTLLDKKISMFYKPLGWSEPVDKNSNLSRFF